MATPRPLVCAEVPGLGAGRAASAAARSGPRRARRSIHPGGRGRPPARPGSAPRRPQNFRRIRRQRTFSFYFALGPQVRSLGSSRGASTSARLSRAPACSPGASWAPGPEPEPGARLRGAAGVGGEGPGGVGATLQMTSRRPGGARPLGSPRKRRLCRAHAAPSPADATRMWRRSRRVRRGK